MQQKTPSKVKLLVVIVAVLGLSYFASQALVAFLTDLLWQGRI